MPKNLGASKAKPLDLNLSHRKIGDILSPVRTDVDESESVLSNRTSKCVSPSKAVPIIYKFMDYAYPDFGHADPLSFLLRSDTEAPESFSVWEYMYNFIAGKTKFQRFNNVLE